MSPLQEFLNAKIKKQCVDNGTELLNNWWHFVKPHNSPSAVFCNFCKEIIYSFTPNDPDWSSKIESHGKKHCGLLLPFI